MAQSRPYKDWPLDRRQRWIAMETTFATSFETSPNDATRDRSRQEVGILADALAHRHIVISLRGDDLRCDD